jgi:hypothetical protein
MEIGKAFFFLSVYELCGGRKKGKIYEGVNARDH